VVTKKGDTMEQRIIKSTTDAITDLIRLTALSDEKLWIDYDKEADVLYVNFGQPQKAEDAKQEAGIIVRKKKNKLVGITILNASRFDRKN
jgi:uncharacterized protein YuzE